MKKITLLMLFLMLGTLGFSQSRLATRGERGNPVDLGTSTLGQQRVPCTQVFPDDGPGVFEDGLLVSPDAGNDWAVADDFTVAACEDFEIQTFTARIFTTPGANILTADVTVYADAGGIPGAVLADANLVPTIQFAVGSNFGLDIHEVLFTIPPGLVLPGGEFGTTYWIGLSDVDEGVPTGVFPAGLNFFQIDEDAPFIGNNVDASADDGTTWGFGLVADAVFSIGGDCRPNTTPPNAVCQNITVTLNAAGNGFIVPADVDGGSNSINGIASLAVDIDTFDCSNVGANNVVLTVTDTCGNSSTCTAVVTVEDNILPNAVCQDITVQLNAAGNATITAADVDGGSNDACGVASLAIDVSTFDCSNIGANNVVLTVTDVNGNVSSCTAIVTVEDNILPNAVCQDITVTLNAAGNGFIVPADVDGGSNDACGIASLAVDIDTFDCSNVGPNNVVLTVTDVNGNVSSCTAVVTVEDNILPNAVCQDITIQLDAAGNASITAADVDGGSNDACGVASLAVDIDTFDCSNVGANNVVLTVTDVNGNVSSCTAVVTVEDNIAPVAVCSNITVQLDAAGNATITPADVDGGSSDACGIASLAVDIDTFDCSNVGANNVVLTVTDNNGNVSSCTAVVTIEDNVAPAAVCSNITVQLDAAGNATITPADVDGGSSDACGIASLAIDIDTFDCSNVGPNNVVLTVTDVNGNSSTCTAVVTVEDNIAPVAVCTDITVQLDAAGNATITPADVDGGSSDACGIASLAVDIDTFDCSNVGANNVVLTVTDVNGNSSTCTAVVTVEDNIAPVAVCSNITVQLDAAGNATITPADVDGGSSDACGIASLAIDVDTFDCSNVGPNNVVLTVTDVNGNVSSCTAVVTVEDNVAPDAVCQNIDVFLDAAGMATITPADVDGGSSDACGIDTLAIDIDTFDCSDIGPNDVTLTVTDVNGNVSTCIAVVTVIDDLPPVINCPMDVIASNDPGICGAEVFFADAIALDVCGVASVVQTGGLPSGSVFPIGDSVIEFTATDIAGNTAVCQFIITVVDDEAPITECQDLLVELDENGVVTVPAGDFLTSASDNCGIVDIVVGSPLGAPGALTTTFAGGNGFQGNMFEIVALADITLNSVDVNMDGGVTDVIEVYWKAGSYVGSENNPGDWTFGGSANVTSAGTNTPTPLNLNMGISLDAGNTYAIYVTATTTNSINYTNGSAEGALWVSNAELEVYEGIGRGSPPFGGGVFSPRNWNGTLHYDTSGEFPVGPDVTFDCSHVGTTQVIEVTVIDAAGNATVCTSNVTVEDNIAPEIFCIGDPAQSEVMSNGSFETGDFTDWTAVDNPDPFLPWGVYAGNDGNGFFSNATPTDGAWLAGNGFDGQSGEAVLYQDVSIAAGATSAMLSWDENIDYDLASFCAGCVDRIYEVQVRDQSDNVLEVVQQVVAAANTIDDDNAWVSLSADLSAYAGQDIRIAFWQQIPDDFSGPAKFALDNVSLMVEEVSNPLQVELDANGMATIDASALLMGVNEACGWTATVGGVGAPMSLETTFAAGNNFNGNMFDINVINGVTFDSFDVHLEDGITDDIEVYFKTGSFVGFETDAGAWTLLETATVTSAGLGAPTPLNMNLGLEIAAGETVAFYVTTTQGGLMQYTNGTALGNVFASDANIEFLEGNGGEYPFNVTFSPRVFNGNIHYTEGDGISTTIDFTCEDLGLNQIEVTVTDDSGNVATCTASVEVLDVTSPILVCQDIIIELDENGHAEVDPADLLATLPGTFEVITISSDNGSNAEGFTDLEVDVTEAADISFDWVYSTDDGPAWDSFGYLLNGVYTELTDPAGDLNQSGSAGPISVAPGDVFGFRSFSADGAFGAATTVVSNFMPGFEGQFDPDNWVLTLDNSDGDAYFVEIPGGPLSFDACGITVLAVDVTDVYCEDIGDPIPVVVFASDASGNIAACNAFITVVDAMGPMITCPEDQTVDPGEDNLFYEVPDYWGEGLATATDNCTDPVTITTQDPAPGDLIPDGVYTVTLTAEDEYGNVSTCEFELTVESVLGITDSALDRAVGIYPNPAENQFTIHNSSSVALSVANIYDVNGKLIRSVDLSQMAAEQTIDVSLLASGVYMVHIIGEEASTIKRLLKE